MEKPGPHCLKKLIKAKFSVIDHVDFMHPLYEVMRMALQLCGLYPNTYDPYLTMREAPDKP